jgi:hypothetical protein
VRRCGQAMRSRRNASAMPHFSNTRQRAEWQAKCASGGSPIHIGKRKEGQPTTYNRQQRYIRHDVNRKRQRTAKCRGRCRRKESQQTIAPGDVRRSTASVRRGRGAMRSDKCLRSSAVTCTRYTAATPKMSR